MINNLSFKCHHECKGDQSPCGPTEFDCKECKHFALDVGKEMGIFIK